MQYKYTFTSIKNRLIRRWYDDSTDVGIYSLSTDFLPTYRAHSNKNSVLIIHLNSILRKKEN